MANHVLLPTRRVARDVSRLVAVLLAGALSLQCSDEDERPRRGAGGSSAAGGTAGTTGGTNAGGVGGTDGGAGSAGSAGADGGAGSAGTDGGAGAAGAGGNAGSGGNPGVCGDGVQSGTESCDAQDFAGQTCAMLGFDSGSLTCTTMCRLDLSQCTGDENCTDGEVDQDRDGALDCADTDCAEACANSCADVEALSDPASVAGETFQHAAQLRGSCLSSDVTSGPEIVYRFTAAHSGVLEAQLRSNSNTDFTLSVRSTCASDGSELGCAQTSSAFQGRDVLRVPITQNQSVFIVVDGTGSGNAGGFSLSLASRPIVCGDGNRDGAEACDDGNVRSLDGCSAACALESDEAEPNGSVLQANAYTTYPFFAAISTSDDVDVFSIAVPAGHTRLLAETFDLGDGACAKYLLDSRLEILNASGTLLEANGDTQSSFCSRVQKTGLAAGTYYVRVTSEGQKPTFPYILNVTSSP